MTPTASIVIFDGVCNLCTWAVQFIIRYDPHGRFLFASLQSDAGIELQHSYGITDTESIVLIEGGRVYQHSDAVLRIARGLVGLWPVFYPLIGVRKTWRDRVYRWVATNRYRWFGKQESCWLPTPALKDRFL